MSNSTASVRAFRNRKKAAGLKEIRGIYLPPELEKKLKDSARRMLAKHERENA